MTLSRFILAFGIALTMLGCGPKKPKETANDFVIPTEQVTPLKIQQQPVAVAEGQPPLYHLFDVGGPIRVVDATAKSQLASTVIADRTLVSIDARRGVVAADTVLMPGPLDANHRYVIYVDPVTENVNRSGIGLPPRIDQK